MKKLITSIAVIITINLGAWSMQASKPATVLWDAVTDNTITRMRLYDVLTTPETLIGEVTCTTAPWSCPTTMQIVMSRAAHQYCLRSVNAEWESSCSNVVTIPGPPQVPVNLRKQ
jgi:hypothetical protein